MNCFVGGLRRPKSKVRMRDAAKGDADPSGLRRPNLERRLHQTRRIVDPLGLRRQFPDSYLTGPQPPWPSLPSNLNCYVCSVYSVVKLWSYFFVVKLCFLCSNFLPWLTPHLPIWNSSVKAMTYPLQSATLNCLRPPKSNSSCTMMASPPSNSSYRASISSTVT